MSTRFKVGNVQYTIKLGYYFCMEELPTKFNIHVLDLLADDEKTNDTLRNLLFNDNVVIQLMWHYMLESGEVSNVDDDYTLFLKKLEPNEVRDFREAFWTEITNFSGQWKKEALEGAWREGKRYLKNLNFDQLHSDLDQEGSKSET